MEGLASTWPACANSFFTWLQIMCVGFLTWPTLQHMEDHPSHGVMISHTVSLCNRDDEDKACGGNQTSIDEHECLTWLASKKPNSVLYVCFGSLSNFSTAQLRERAMGLEASGQQFLWVARKEKTKEEWLPEGFEKQLEGRGLIIWGWAPQVLILDHEAIGGFMTHCGWNSVLEGLTAGVPLITWPLFAEQFSNEKLVTDILKIYVKREDIEKAAAQLMVGEEAEEMRSRAHAQGDMAKKAVAKGGSSYSDLIGNIWIKGKRTAELITQRPWYVACNKCNRSTMEDIGTSFTCIECNTEQSTATARSILPVQIKDNSGSFQIAIFGPHAKKLVGHSADALVQLNLK
ncbi:unnamed protein product [Camellia sinensis]